MFTFLLAVLAGAGTFYQVLERAKEIQSTMMYNHAVYSFGAVLLITNLALAIIKHNFLGRKAARVLHGFLQTLSVSAILYSGYNIYSLYEHYSKPHVWTQFLTLPLNDNLFVKAHGAAGLFVTSMLCLVALGSSLTIGPFASEKAVAANGPSHAAGGKFFFTLMCFICNFGAFLAFGEVDPIIAAGTGLVWVFALLPGKKAQVKQQTPTDKKDN